ncbi:hypothetical protein LCGC14_1515450 [marine sediment metagenome]|uniref:Uncharacterized protein n=1 Tax=marine sediment metagenome TaxID=412755 RepID=A0A0F9LFR0_9ZZZZ
MGLYRKRPVMVEAEQFWPEKRPWPKPVACCCICQQTTYNVTTIHGQLTLVVPGDWIIVEPDGIHAYPCKPDIFEATYEAAEAAKPAEKPKGWRA